MVVIEPVERSRMLKIGSEESVLWSMVDFYRATLLSKCSGLDEEQLKRRAVNPSSLSLLGLLRHCTATERYFFEECLEGGTLAPLYSTIADPDGDFNDLDSLSAAQVVHRFLEQCDRSRVIAAAHSFDDVAYSDVFQSDLSLRFVAVHLVDEYARHCGHADLLREVIDGSVGH